MKPDVAAMTDELLERAEDGRPKNNDPLLLRICSEFLDMPGLYLTAPQAARLFGVEPTACEALLAKLVQVRFLRRTPTGFYGLLDRSTASQFEIYVS
jgi:hypothetical protein